MSTPAPNLAATTLAPGARAVEVRTASRIYSAVIAAGLLARLPELVAQSLGGTMPARAALFADEGIAPETLSNVAASLRTAGVTLCVRTFAARESVKSMDTVREMLETLAAHAMERSHPVIALGGGIIGDMSGFAASSYRRGVPWINCPSTLLSMVDASVGGKTGVNIRTGESLRKNMAGAFWQPSLVVADVALLDALPARVFRAGLAECIKHAMLAAKFDDSGLAAWTERHLSKVMSGDHAARVELVARNISVKARVVEIDEREELPDTSGGRALLNLGHTFGHAIETIPQLSPTGNPADAPLQHGEAVALGLCAAAHLSAAMRLAPPELLAQTLEMLTRAGLPTRVRALPASEDVLSAMMHDKKVAGGSLRLILPLADGTCRVVRDAPRELVLKAIDSIREA